MLTKSTNLSMKVGNDNGNHEHAILFDGYSITQPNVFRRLISLPSFDRERPEDYLYNLHDKLIVTIVSPALSMRAGNYMVGTKALNAINSDGVLTSLDVRVDKKHEVDLPIVNTLAHIAAAAITKSYERENTIPDHVSVKVDMTTALPIKYHTDETERAFQLRFMKGPHQVTVHLAKRPVQVEIVFDFVFVMPEGAPAVFSLAYERGQNLIDRGNDEKVYIRTGKIQPRKGDLFKEFIEKYNLPKNLDGKYFEDKRIVHIDIGDGTTDAAVTLGLGLDRNVEMIGTYNGSGHAIDQAIPFFEKAAKLENIQRQEFSAIYRNPNHKYHTRAVTALEVPVRDQSRAIYNLAERLVKNLNNDFDIMTVYGGGSIMMRPQLHPMLEELCKEAEVKLFYVPSEHATTILQEGLDVVVHSSLYEEIKAEDLPILKKMIEVETGIDEVAATSEDSE